MSVCVDAVLRSCPFDSLCRGNKAEHFRIRGTFRKIFQAAKSCAGKCGLRSGGRCPCAQSRWQYFVSLREERRDGVQQFFVMWTVPWFIQVKQREESVVSQMGQYCDSPAKQRHTIVVNDGQGRSRHTGSTSQIVET